MMPFNCQARYCSVSIADKLLLCYEIETLVVICKRDRA